MAGYNTPGPYKTGVWLVVFSDGRAGWYGRNSLPKPDGKTQYYWVGADYNKAASSGLFGDDPIDAAISKLGADPDKLPVLNQSLWNQLIAGGSGKTKPGAGVTPTNPAIAGPPINAAKGFFGDIGSAIQSTTDFLQLIAWIFHPRNMLRAVEFVSGMALIGFGLWAAVQAHGERRESFTTGESALSRSGLGRVSRELAATRSVRSVRSAPHRTRRTALRQRYEREESLSRRRQEARRRR